MIRRPSRSTLFPYDALPISEGLAAALPLGGPDAALARAAGALLLPRLPAAARDLAAALRVVRSEEHTSELQSPDHLVCRLLLEKKKNTTNYVAYTIATANLT